MSRGFVWRVRLRACCKTSAADPRLDRGDRNARSCDTFFDGLMARYGDLDERFGHDYSFW